MQTGACKVLIVFNAGAAVYGMERAVIEIFDLLRPEVEPHFLMSYTTARLDLPILQEIRRRGLAYSFFSDRTDWPRIGKPKSLSDAWTMLTGVARGNRDVLKLAGKNDFIYVPGLDYVYFAFLALLLYRLRGKRNIYHFHDLITRPSRRLRTSATLLTDYIHNTAWGRKRMNQTNGWLRKKQQHVIPLVVRRDLTARSACSLGESAAQINIAYVGQVARHKGVDLLLLAFQELAKSRTNLVLNIVGGCNEPLLLNQLEAAAAETSGAVKWRGYQEDVATFLRTADIYVQPSPPSRFEESFCLGAVEAMSVGIPVVCFRSGALQEIVANEQTGLICEEETAASLAWNILRFVDDADLRRRCGKSAREQFEQKYSEGQVKSRWLSLFGILKDEDSTARV